MGSLLFFFSSRRRHTRLQGDWSSDVCSSDLPDEFKFRFAWWGFYDGIFDYANGKWEDALRNHPRARQSESDNVNGESFAFNDENKNVRNILGKRNRIKELYLDFTNDRIFLRHCRP